MTGEGTGDFGRGIAIDRAGDAFVTGYTTSLDFPVTSDAFQAAIIGNQNAFLTELNPSGDALVYSTYFGGGDNGGPDSAFGVRVDDVGGAYIAGTTHPSPKFPTTAGAFETQFPASTFSAGYIAKFDVGTGTLVTATPTFAPTGGSYTSAQSVTITDSTPTATIYYTTDGSTPTASSTEYSGAIAVSHSTTINAIAVASGYSNSAEATATYAIQQGVATPTVTVTPSSSSITTAQSDQMMVTVSGGNGNPTRPAPSF